MLTLTFPTFKHAPGQDYPGDDSTSFAGHKRRGSANPGVDFGTPVGTPVYAPSRIRITETWPRDTGSGGLFVRARCLNDDGTESRFAILCLHLSEILCSVGDEFERGERFALTGDSGNVVRHLHFTLFLDGVQVDPMLYLTATIPVAARPITEGEDDMARFIAADDNPNIWYLTDGMTKRVMTVNEPQVMVDTGVAKFAENPDGTRKTAGVNLVSAGFLARIPDNTRPEDRK